MDSAPFVRKIINTQSIATVAVFSGILCLAFWIRIQGRNLIPDGQFTGPDAYFYYWQAQLISEHGTLPERDMHRWLPVGRDLGQTLNLYGYALAYTHKVLAWLFPSLSLYRVAFYAPVICFCIGLCVLCFFLHHTYGLLFSVSVGVLLTTLPGTIDRSLAGFADRDSWCFLLGILAVTTYLTSLQARHPSHRFLWTLASGFFMYLGALSWEAFGVFLSVILVVELWRFLSSETEDGLGYYILWVLTFVPTLYLSSPAYRNGYGFAKHLFAFMLVPPVVVLGIRTTRYLLTTYCLRFIREGSAADKIRHPSRTLALGLTIASLALALCYLFAQYHTFTDTTVLFRQNALLQTVGELRPPRLKYWIFRYGSVFILGGIGSIIASKIWGNPNFMFTPLILFTVTTFFREPIEKYIWNAGYNTQFFSIILIYCTIAFLLTAVCQKTCENKATLSVAFTAWFLIWGTLARDARRYDLFISVPLAFFTTVGVQHMTQRLAEKIWHSKYMSEVFRKDVLPSQLKNVITLAMLGLILLWPTTGGHARRAHKNAKQLHQALPGKLPVTQTFRWMKAELPQNAVVAARWRYGSMLNVLGGVKTIIDQDHYIQNWIHLYQQYVQKGNDTRAALAFLKTHQATHLMITDKHPPPAVKNATQTNAFREVFVPVYPNENFENARVKIWELHYPPDIQADPKYLRTGIPEIDAQLPQH